MQDEIKHRPVVLGRAGIAGREPKTRAGSDHPFHARGKAPEALRLQAYWVSSTSH